MARQRREIMKKEFRQWKTRRRGLIGALALAAWIAPTILVTQPLQAQSFVVIYSFTVGDGVDTKPGLVLDSAGNVYGTTPIGGIGDGEVFKVDTSGAETVLYSFTGSDGAGPAAGLVQDKEGNLYGTTEVGNSPSLGTVFKLDTNNAETVLYSFTGADGAIPLAPVLRDGFGNLYGTTFSGGIFGQGTVFKLDPAGREIVLHNFTGGTDGANPTVSLVPDKSGNLYGTAYGGGLIDCFGAGCGVVYRLGQTGRFTVMHSFTGPDGAGPESSLVRDEAGNFYGATLYGGTFKEGTVFKLDRSGRETVLYSFTGGTDGASPRGDLVRDEAGNLYGTTVYGGTQGCTVAPSGCGVVFKLDPAGVQTVLHSFSGETDGGILYGGLARDGAGNLYGTTSSGGVSGTGTVFKITP
jgi:uncharacterized repeat protein (TIGR03803 family)